MSDNKNEIGTSSSIDAVKMGSTNGTVTLDESTGMVSEHGYFWVGVKLPKSLIFGGLAYVAGGGLGVYGGPYVVFLAGILALYLYFFRL